MRWARWRRWLRRSARRRASRVDALERVALPTGGALNVDTLSAVVGALLPDDAVVVDEAVTASVMFVERTAGAGEHDYLFLTGGSIGWGMPAATGAAVGAPGRPVVNLEADGSAMYTIQSLWTQAREGLDVTTIIIANRSYAILEFEFSRVGAEGDGRGRARADGHRAAGARLRRAGAVDGRAGAAGRRRAGDGRARCARRSASPART